MIPGPSKKLGKVDVNYEFPSRSADRCGTCVNFEPRDGCKVVRGVINAKAWCIKFASAHALQMR